MDPVFLARLQFAFTVGFHFIFPPITIGLSWLIFGFLHRYKKTGDSLYAVQARFWTKLFAITFAVGVATGITMEFQFGTNWAEYSRFVGDIFGAPLAAEAVLAFFLESTFMGVLLFGWGRFQTRTLWTAALLVAVGSTLSAFWIIVANSWMQTPAGYHIVNGRAELTDFFAAVFNPSTIPRYFHTIVASLITGAFFMLGISAWYLVKQRHVTFAKQALKLSLIVSFTTAVLQLLVGHLHTVQVANTQPEKLAAFEGLFETQTEAPALLFGLPDEEAAEVVASLEVPGALSVMISGDPSYEVKGLNDFPRDEWPPILPTFFSFHLMFYLGMYFIGFTLLGLVLLWKDKLYNNTLFLKLAVLSLPLPIIANELGWIAAEVGRQPWIVYRVPGMLTKDSISFNVSGGEIVASLVMFALIYGLLGFFWVYLLRKAIRKGPSEEEVRP